jgi:guanine nucleotide-binding protein subunit alpha
MFFSSKNVINKKVNFNSFQAHAQTVLVSSSCFDKSFNILPNVAMALQALWQDRGVRLAVARGYEYELNDSAI